LVFSHSSTLSLNGFCNAYIHAYFAIYIC
jgi:hypothetical protein